MSITPLRTAQALAARNIAVFPCQRGRKEPATAHGLKDATTDMQVIRQWWRERPDCNLAVATGAVSQIFVLDIDGLDAEHDLNKLEHELGSLPPTVESITARGRHVWFKYPARPVRNSAGKVAPGCDIRGDGGYVLVPPSVHPSGRRYEWSVDCAALAPAPDWLIDKVSLPTKTEARTPEDWQALVANGVGEGARDCTITKLAGHLLRRRVDPRVVFELLLSWNGTKCTPPISAVDVERIVVSITNRELKRRADDQ